MSCSRLFIVLVTMLCSITASAQEVVIDNKVRRDTTSMPKTDVMIPDNSMHIAPEASASFHEPLIEKPDSINPKALERPSMQMPVLIGWKNGVLIGNSSSFANLTNFGNKAGITGIQHFGRLSLSANASLSKSMVNGVGVVNSFGGSGSLDYYINKNISLTGFGGMNAFGILGSAPNMNTYYYGGTVNLKTNNGKWGMDLGVQRVYNPMNGRWETVPIAMPYYNLNGQKLGIDVGGILYSLFRSASESVNNNSMKFDETRGPAIIAPPINTMPKFGSPEVPKYYREQ